MTGIDHQIFKWINSGTANDLFDRLMPVLREKSTWIPVYILILLWLVWKYKMNTIAIVLLAVATVVLTDQLSSSFLKPLVERLRPCNNPEFREQVRLVVECGVGYSFPSSHAANHFGFSVFLAVVLKLHRKWVLPLGLFWAISVCFAQIYVGVHYPSDILAGAVLGTLIGLTTGLICRKLLAKRIL